MNGLIRKYSETDPKLHFIETAAEFLNEQGKPRDELFVEDRLHLNADGYKLWSSIIKRELTSVLDAPRP